MSHSDEEFEILRVHVESYKIILDCLLKANRHNGETKKVCAVLADPTAQCNCGKFRLDAILKAAIVDPWNAVIHIDEILEHLSGDKADGKQ